MKVTARLLTVEECRETGAAQNECVCCWSVFRDDQQRVASPGIAGFLHVECSRMVGTALIEAYRDATREGLH